MYVVKNKLPHVTAFQLGSGSPLEKNLLSQGLLRLLPDGTYEVFSRETLSGRGQKAEAGDYIKLDTGGNPYPNKKTWFEARHRHICGNTYEQIPQVLKAWSPAEPMCEEIAWLLEKKRLSLHPETPDRYFRAFLWGAPLSAAEDAVVLFYRTDRAEDGSITDIDFNFVVREEFERTYQEA